jgi:excisionase family DNA binding protein
MNQARRTLAIAASTPAPTLPVSIRPEEAQASHQAVPPLAAPHPEPSPTFERVLNTEEAAALLQIHPKTLQKMAREGSVPAFRIGDLWRFRASALDEWLRSGVCSKRHSCLN